MLCGLIDNLDIQIGNSDMFFLASGFSTLELDKLNKIIAWSFHNINTLTKEKFIKKFETNLPRKKDMLNAIVKVYRKDDMFSPI